MAPKLNLKDKVEDGEIDLSLSDLQDVPVKEIALIAKAHSLDLSNNHLTILPKNFPVLTNIIKLDLSKNQLKELPEDFGNLVKLKHLDLYKNQLQHLPLSFSKLKALRWLDLKDNPLVPAIKETAGDCLDAKQCQQCAKNIVIFYANLEEKVNKERETREKQRQKDRQANELANQKLKQQEKKLKKKDKLKKKEIDEVAVVQETKTIKSQEPIIEEEIIEKKVQAGPWSFVKFIFLLSLLIGLVLFVLTSVKFKHTEVVEEKTVLLWNQLLKTLPPYIQEIGNTSSVYIRSVHNLTGKGFIIIARHCVELKYSETFNNIVNSINNFYNMSVQQFSKYYNSLFTKSNIN